MAGAGASRRRGIVVVDHGSRRPEANEALHRFVADFAAYREEIVEPAHLELAHPTIAEAYRRCVERGARTVVVAPFFLWPGKHWERDIPNQVAAAAAEHPGTTYLVAGTIGSDPLMHEVLAARVDRCVAHAGGTVESCALCADSVRCHWAPAPADATRDVLAGPI